MKIFKTIVSIIFLTIGFLGCRNPTAPLLPSFKISLNESSTVLNSDDFPKGNPIALFYFSPDCKHCQQETTEILNNMQALKHIRFYFITTDSFEGLKRYKEFYHLSNYQNITLAKDFESSFYEKYKPAGTPYLLLYDKGRRLIAIINGQVETTKILNIVKHL